MFRDRRGFTLIELLIVVAIIAILAAIAVPNFLEAQTRAKVSRVKADLRTLVTGLESYRVDHNRYPEGSDNPAKWDPAYAAFFGPLATGYYTLASRQPGTAIAGRDFATLTTPVAYLTSVLSDPFAEQKGARITYQYRDAKATKNGFIVTSFGPDADILNPNGVGSLNTVNPLSTGTDTGTVKRLGDINERGVIHYVEKTDGAIVTNVNANYGSILRALDDLSYDPTNGTVSEGDIYRFAP